MQEESDFVTFTIPQAELFKDIKVIFDNNYLSFFLTKVGSE